MCYPMVNFLQKLSFIFHTVRKYLAALNLINELSTFQHSSSICTNGLDIRTQSASALALQQVKKRRILIVLNL